ncbi:MAG: amidohydrolase family protein [Cytophagales bacterium]
MKRITMRNLMVSISFLCVAYQSLSQGLVFKNATIHVGNGVVIENGILVTEKDKIEFVGLEKDCKIDLSAKKAIAANNSHIYPGLISLYSNAGLIEIEAVRASADYFEIGDVNAHIRAGIAFNIDSDILPTLLSNGVLITQVTPRGAFICGNSDVVYLNGWSVEEARIKADEGMHINWPTFYAPNYASEEAKTEFAANRLKQLQALKQLFLEAKVYDAKLQSTANLRLESLKAIFDDKKTLYIAADQSKEILEIISFVKELGIKKTAIVGAQDALEVAEEMAKNDIYVILKCIHNTPPLAESDVDYIFKLPYQLKKKGVKVALSYSGNMESMNARNLAFLAGSAASYGLSKEEALSSITSIPAQILGLDSEIGSLQVGKQASFVISKGDILDMRSSKITKAFIKGQEIVLDDKQKTLNARYEAKYKLK